MGDHGSDPRREYGNPSSTRPSSRTSGGRHQLVLHSTTNSGSIQEPPVMPISWTPSQEDVSNGSRSSQVSTNGRLPQREDANVSGSMGTSATIRRVEIAGGIPVLPVHGQPPSVQPWRFPAQPISRPPRLELTSESGVESGSGTDAGCRTIQVNPDAVEVNTQQRLWLAFPDGTRIPRSTAKIVVGFYSTTDQVRRAFVEGHRGHNSLLVTVDHPVEKVMVEIRTDIEPNGRVLGRGYLKFVLPPQLQPPQLMTVPSTEQSSDFRALLEAMRCFVPTTESARDGEDGCENVQSRRVTTTIFVCRSEDVQVKEAFAFLTDEMYRGETDSRAVLRLPSKPNRKPDGDNANRLRKDTETEGLYDVVSICPQNKNRTERPVPCVPTIHEPFETGLQVPSSINFSHQKLVEMFVQLQKGTITVNRAIEDMRDIVYSDTSTLMPASAMSRSKDNRKVARERVKMSRSEELENRSRTSSGGSSTLTVNYPPQTIKRKEKLQSSGRSTCDARSLTEDSHIEAVYNSSLPRSEELYDIPEAIDMCCGSTCPPVSPVLSGDSGLDIDIPNKNVSTTNTTAS